jgi:hypothetical protein
MTRVRYDQLIDAGIFGPKDRVELLDGLLVAREPQGGPHATAVGLVAAALDKAFGRFPRSEPEPTWCRTRSAARLRRRPSV